MLNARERRAVVTTAALRSAVAWSRRAGEARVWREIARMTGVIMNARGPDGPVTPAELVALLYRPLGYLLPSLDEPSALDAVTLLDADGELSEAAMEIACDYSHALFDGRDPATEWLPWWAWQCA